MKLLVALAVAILVTASDAAAQVRLRGFADVGTTTLTAKESFTAITGTNSGVVFGGGAEAGVWSGLFVSLRASQFKKEGQRIFVFNGERFDLGIPVSITITPIELSGGWRFMRSSRLMPYAAGGIGFHRYRETSEFATDDEDVAERFTGFHVLGGVEYRINRFIGAAGEAQWTTIPNAIGDDPGSVAAAFDEHDLGGVTVRVKVVVGR